MGSSPSAPPAEPCTLPRFPARSRRPISQPSANCAPAQLRTQKRQEILTRARLPAAARRSADLPVPSAALSGAGRRTEQRLRMRGSYGLNLFGGPVIPASIRRSGRPARIDIHDLPAWRTSDSAVATRGRTLRGNPRIGGPILIGRVVLGACSRLASPCRALLVTVACGAQGKAQGPSVPSGWSQVRGRPDG